MGTQDMINSLFQTLSGGSTLGGVPLQELPQNMQILQQAFGANALANINKYEAIGIENNNDTIPKGFLNILLFDEQLQLLGDSRRIQIPLRGSGGTADWSSLSVADGLAIALPGYMITYISNESIGRDVWFDDISISNYRGAVLDEHFYYPFGLTLSSESAEETGQPYKYQGIELEKSFGLETYETFYRGLDPQLGRFNSIDPKPNYSLSPYASMGNNPIFYTDPLGDTTHFYGSNSVLFLTINDKLPNQVHFMHFPASADNDAITVDGNNGRTKMSEDLRAISQAFLGDKSAKSLEKIAMKSANSDKGDIESGLELGFYGIVSNTREVIFQELAVPTDIKPNTNGVWDERSFPIGAVIKKFVNNGGSINCWFTLGHTHTAGWFKSGNSSQKSISDNNWEGARKNLLQNYGTPSSVDYGNHLNKSYPRIIASPLGISIHGDSKRSFNGSKNTIFYNWFKR